MASPMIRRDVTAVTAEPAGCWSRRSPMPKCRATWPIFGDSRVCGPPESRATCARPVTTTTTDGSIGTTDQGSTRKPGGRQFRRNAARRFAADLDRFDSGWGGPRSAGRLLRGRPFHSLAAAVRFWRSDPALELLARDFLARHDANMARWLAERQENPQVPAGDRSQLPEAARRGVSYLQLFDAISLWLCCAERHEPRRIELICGRGLDVFAGRRPGERLPASPGRALAADQCPVRS